MCLLLHGMPSAVRDLRSQLNAKFNITSDCYWLSRCGKPLHDDFEDFSWSSYYEWTSGWYAPGLAVLNAV